MINTSLGKILLAVLLTTSLGACGSRQRSAPLSPDALYERGMTAFQAGNHSRAVQSLESFLQRSPADTRAPRARYTVGEARLARREHLLAAADFTRVLNDFPQDPLGQNARFGLCEAYRALSPRPELDQQYTASAIAYCESFAGLFPASPDASRASAWVADMERKLAEKGYNAGFFYFRRGAYDAGVIYFTQVLENYPRSQFAPRALLRLMESYERIGYEEEAEEARTRLVRDFPESPEARSLPQPGAAPQG